MRLVEFFVAYVQAWLPNWLLLRILEVIFWLVGLKSRWQYDRTIRSIAIDRTERAAKPVTTDVDVTNMQVGMRLQSALASTPPHPARAHTHLIGRAENGNACHSPL